MRLTWQQIRDHYRNACGNATAAMDEEWSHLNAALQWVCDQVDVHELLTTTSRGCEIGKDVVPLPADLYSIYSVVNTTGEYRLDPEPAGMRGRTRYLVDNGKPPSGQPRFYALLGSQLYLRDTPDAADTLVIYFKKQPAAVSASDLAATPIVPDQYHWPLVYYSAANYFSLHPDEDNAGVPQGGQPRSSLLIQKAGAGLVATPTQKQKEDVDRREYVRLSGYSFDLRGR